MLMRGDWNSWGQHSAGEMKLVDDFTWGIAVTKVGYARAKSAPFAMWSKAHDVQADRELRYNLPTYDDRHKTFEIDPYMSGSEASWR